MPVVVGVGIVEPDHDAAADEVADQRDRHVADRRGDIDAVVQAVDQEQRGVGHAVLEAQEREQEDGDHHRDDLRDVLLDHAVVAEQHRHVDQEVAQDRADEQISPTGHAVGDVAQFGVHRMPHDVAEAVVEQ
jgi:hypothetical protein